MFFIHCPYCHKQVFRWNYARHKARHTQIQPDGQMADHVTLEPAKRFAGPIDEVPKQYKHATCGVTTEMPEDHVRSYLADPFLYDGTAFCCECGKYRPYEEFTWRETEESLETYFRGLQAEYLTKHDGKRPPRPAV